MVSSRIRTHKRSLLRPLVTLITYLSLLATAKTRHPLAVVLLTEEASSRSTNTLRAVAKGVLVRGLEASFELNAALTSLDGFLSTSCRVVDEEEPFAELVAAAKHRMILDLNLKLRVGHAVDLESLMIPLNHACGGFD